MAENKPFEIPPQVRELAEKNMTRREGFTISGWRVYPK